MMKSPKNIRETYNIENGKLALCYKVFLSPSLTLFQLSLIFIINIYLVP